MRHGDVDAKEVYYIFLEKRTLMSTHAYKTSDSLNETKGSFIKLIFLVPI
jgi:hypothetical protein